MIPIGLTPGRMLLALLVGVFSELPVEMLEVADVLDTDRALTMLSDSDLRHCIAMLVMVLAGDEDILTECATRARWIETEPGAAPLDNPIAVADCLRRMPQILGADHA